MNITESFNDVLRMVITFLPKFVVFLVILLIGWLVAKALRKAVSVVLHRMNFDAVVERGGIKQALERSKFDASGLIAALVFYAVMLITLQLAFGVFGSNPVSDVLTSIVAWLPRAIVAVLIVIIATAAASILRDLAMAAMGALSFGPLMAKIIQVAVIVLGVIAALNQVGIATTVTGPVLIAVLAAVVGILVVGVGGGLLRPMQDRWDRWLTRAEHDIPAARAQSEAYDRGREDAMRQEQATREQATREQVTRSEQPVTTTPPPARHRAGDAPPLPPWEH
ncbi:mechanosensitive ion channel family protein [Actinophytocola sp.]|uniref:mechanosensitive ion channel family protein n=1 Tax=Actinophytocola sp. TaxID=1872138 RepID=UPI002ED69112